jgi:hypothetical protein
MAKAKAGRVKGQGKADSGAKSRPRVAAEGVEATPGVMNVQGLALELSPLQVIVLRDFWDQAVPREALESFIDVPKSKRCGCSSVFPWSKESRDRG